jgi:hypothetical protein
MFKNRGMRKKFGPKRGRGEVTGDLKKLHAEALHYYYYYYYYYASHALFR